MYCTLMSVKNKTKSEHEQLKPFKFNSDPVCGIGYCFTKVQKKTWASTVPQSPSTYMNQSSHRFDNYLLEKIDSIRLRKLNINSIPPLHKIVVMQMCEIISNNHICGHT